MEHLLTLMKERRSIRKYQDKQIPMEELEKILEAGLYAPNAGGGQRSKIVAIHNKELAEKIGKLNVAQFNRANLAGSYVSSEQPSIIDDPSIHSLFDRRVYTFTIAEQYKAASNHGIRNIPFV